MPPSVLPPAVTRNGMVTGSGYRTRRVMRPVTWSSHATADLYRVTASVIQPGNAPVELQAAAA
jgi:hypothetical protein